MHTLTDTTGDLHVAAFTPIPSPAALRADLPVGDERTRLVQRTRDEVRAILSGDDQRLLVIVGPCSIHDPAAGLEYAGRLARAAHEHRDELLIVMRTYFEKPRTTIGWKGLINDPHLDGSHDIAAGLRLARAFLRDVTALGLPCATEFLEPISPQYIADLITWGAIGARTTESQIHRQLASGLSMPIGFKNGTDGGLQVALDAAAAASSPQSFLGVDADGRASLVATTGNPDTGVILRGGADGPNFDAAHVEQAAQRLAAAGLTPRLVVDASHANSGKDHVRQAEVAREIAAQLAGGPAHHRRRHAREQPRRGRAEARRRARAGGADLRSERHRRLHGVGCHLRRARDARRRGARRVDPYPRLTQCAYAKVPA